MFDLDKSEIYRKAKMNAVSTSALIHDKIVKGEEAKLLRQESLGIVMQAASINGWFHRNQRMPQFVALRSSIHSFVALLDILKEEQILSEDQFNTSTEVLDDLSRMLYGMIKKAEEAS